MTLSEIAEAVDLPVSTAARFISTMLQDGYLKKDGRNYYLGHKLFYLGSIAALQFNMDRTVEPIMKELAAVTNDYVSLNVLSQYHRVCVKKVEGDASIRMFVKVGEPLPLYAGSAGKVLLAYQPEEYWDEYFALVKPKPLTPNTETDVDKIRQALKKIRVDGYCLTIGERISGTISVSAPIFDKDRTVKACLTIGKVRLDEEDNECYLAEIVKMAAQKTSTEMGYIKQVRGD
jgi:DNA-binding IclR family transcriptional regulator